MRGKEGARGGVRAEGRKDARGRGGREGEGEEKVRARARGRGRGRGRGCKVVVHVVFFVLFYEYIFVFYAIR